MPIRSDVHLDPISMMRSPTLGRIVRTFRRAVAAFGLLVVLPTIAAAECGRPEACALANDDSEIFIGRAVAAPGGDPWASRVRVLRSFRGTARGTITVEVWSTSKYTTPVELAVGRDYLFYVYKSVERGVVSRSTPGIAPRGCRSRRSTRANWRTSRSFRAGPSTPASREAFTRAAPSRRGARRRSSPIERIGRHHGHECDRRLRIRGAASWHLRHRRRSAARRAAHGQRRAHRNGGARLCHCAAVDRARHGGPWPGRPSRATQRGERGSDGDDARGRIPSKRGTSTTRADTESSDFLRASTSSASMPRACRQEKAFRSRRPLRPARPTGRPQTASASRSQPISRT